MESVKHLSLDLPNTSIAMERSILHLVKFPSLTSFKLNLGLNDLEHLDDALRCVSFLAEPTSVADVTLVVGAEMDSYGGRVPLHAIEKWCSKFKALKSFTLDSDRNRSHGLFAFSESVDVLKVVDNDHKKRTEGMP